MADAKCPECDQECDQECAWIWCKPCNSTHFRNYFDKWTSRNEKIDKFIQDVQLNADDYDKAIEWIPYDRFQDIKQIAKGGFGTIYYAEWIDGNILNWDTENRQWVRFGKLEVVLKRVDDIEDIIENFLNEMAILLRTNGNMLSTTLYGITKDPETHKYLMVLKYLKGGEEYTKAADVYSFAIIAYEIITGFQPYSDVAHDNDLALKICNGLRPKIPFHTPKLITQVIMRCWDARTTHRPTFGELHKELDKYYCDYKRNNYENNNEITILIKETEEFSKNQETTDTTTKTPLNYKTHPQAIYTSRLLNFSNLPRPKNEENFEKELEELTESFSHIITNDDVDDF
ncbi:hypothetical protein Glove_71g80 [Diversispora epigaea]|uniref:Serine-threonine/tyrosine-protein kinase catalytic domain-containing protein n=1 Tax=Diversispora epigaea TaxID=1348612 RepID=A0A397J9W2_9GLOM|nr:hypothetical protein Glove_71g80 [Diversispora epigaea]